LKDALGSVQSVLVLGGGSDIAGALLRLLVARRTTTIGLAARDPATLAGRVLELRRAGGRVETLRFDADDTASHAAFVAEAFEQLGELDLVVLAFGVLGGTDPGSDEAVQITQTNYVGAVSVLLPIADRLRQQGHGTIVVLSSVAGERVRKSNFVYGASKAALDGFAQGLGDSLAGTGVQVLIVRPGFVTTKMTEGMKPAPLSTTPEAVADAVVDGIAKGAQCVWVPSTLRWVMAGLRHVPRPLFRRLPI
jgi:decaprenylphospho-beta-D-erythro-pentofuranosid-2-ulose 2-reductase